MPVPEWVKDAVFYQIFPDRFANGDLNNDPANVHPWGSQPTPKGFQGGDLQGIIKHFDYLVDLGITALYLNPIFMSPSTHRYDTVDYLRIDPKLGDLSDFHALIDTAHRSGVRVVLDGVFNHCGRGFFAFNDILENGEESPYLDWFHIKRFPVDAYGKGNARNFKAWWGIKSLPKFNTDNRQVRRYLLDVGRFWIEQGADGWRLDVPNEIDDDSFWAEFRQVVTTANSQAYILGEIWDVQPRWADDHHFDGLMNYPVRTAIHDLVMGRHSSLAFAERVEQLLTVYPQENVFAQYLLLGSHDTERVMTLFEGDVEKVKLAFLFMFTYPGAPSIYYGDEIGLTGGKDPDCRAAFPWEESQWNQELRGWIKDLVAMRKSQPALHRGDLVRLLAQEEPNVYCFARVLGQDTVVMAMNTGMQAVTVRIPTAGLGLAEGQMLTNLIGYGQAPVQNGEVQVTIPAVGGAILKPGG